MINRFYFLALFLALTLGGAPNLRSQWVQTNGPYGGTADCFLTVGSELYAGAGNAIYRSSDNGASWVWFSKGLLQTVGYGVYNGLARIGTYFFTSSRDSGMLRSTDNGLSWTTCNTGLTNAKDYIHNVAVVGTSIFALSVGIYRSVDSGNNWVGVNNGLPSMSVYALDTIGSNIFIATSQYGVFRSTNNGTDWTPVNNGLTNKFVRALTTNGTDIYAGTFGGVFVSKDLGANWSAVNSGLKDTNIWDLAAVGGNIFAGTESGLYRSSDNGDSWTKIINGIGNRSIYAIGVSGENMYIGAYPSGILRSTDMGLTWEASNIGFKNTTISTLATRGSDLFAGTLWGGIPHTTDSGNNWSSINQGFPSINLFSIAIDGTDIFAATNDGIFRSSDDGISWIRAGLAGVGISSIIAHDNKLFAGSSDSGLFRSTDKGSNWVSVAEGMVGTGITYRSKDVYSMIEFGNTLLAGTSEYIFRSTNDGDSWNRVYKNSSFLNTKFIAFATDSVNIYASLYEFGIYLSTDSGLNWKEVPRHGLGSTRIRALATRGTNLFAGGEFPGGIFQSRDKGVNWVKVDTNLLNNNTNALLVSGSELYAGTGGSAVWRRSLSEMINSNSVTHPETISYDVTIFPNPASKSATLAFDLPKSSSVEIVIDNVMGERIYDIRESLNEFGHHEILLDLSGFAEGTYFVQLKAGEAIQTSSFQIIR